MQRCLDHSLDEQERAKSPGRGKAKALKTDIHLMTPIQPMLAKKAEKLADVFAKSPKGIYCEIKYDGERIQIHKNGGEFAFFSRNLKAIPNWKVDNVKPHLLKSTNAESIILDGELLLMDNRTGQPLPFGSLNVHKKNNFSDACVCVIVFDILYLNGKVLLEIPIEERRKLMIKNVNVKKILYLNFCHHY